MINEKGLLVGVGIELIDLGLMRGTFDACSLVHTHERDLVFKFALPVFKAPDGYLYGVKGQSLDPNHLEGKKIGFLDGSFTNERCLTQYSKDFVAYPHLIKHYTICSLSAAIDDMKNGTLNGFFGLDVFTASQLEELNKVSPPYACHLGGLTMMSHKNSAFTANWNVGFTKLKVTNKFKKFCEEANARHSLRPNARCLT